MLKTLNYKLIVKQTVYYYYYCLRGHHTHPHVWFPSYKRKTYSKFAFSGINFMLLALILESIYLLSNLKVLIRLKMKISIKAYEMA
jgi:hypothetical protein